MTASWIHVFIYFLKLLTVILVQCFDDLIVMILVWIKWKKYLNVLIIANIVLQPAAIEYFL